MIEPVLAATLRAAAPLAAAARLAGRRGRVLLHGGRDDGGGCGRFSFVACEPEASLEARGHLLALRGPDGALLRQWCGDPLAALETLLAEREAQAPAARDRAPVPLALGYLGYDLARGIERLGCGPPPQPDDPPDLWVGFYGAVWRYDAAARRAELVGGSAAARRRLGNALGRGAATVGRAPRFAALRADEPEAIYRHRVARIRDYIAAGDVYQVNLARRLVATLERDGDALALYCAVLGCFPAAYGAVIETDEARIISASPERFLARAPASRRLETRPIKGTRRRTGDGARDREVAAALLRDPKELAEHLMIVDLERNDLGCIAEIGTVRADRSGRLLELSTLFHLVSTISCRLRRDVGVAEILRATFPGGSITGAPKIRAMEIIDELEPVRRGPYTGAIGYFGRDGALDLSIAIRTAVVAGEALRLHVGGGIVADSRPERELEETEEKAAAWRRGLAALAGRPRPGRSPTASPRRQT